MRVILTLLLKWNPIYSSRYNSKKNWSSCLDEKLVQIEQALVTIERRFSSIKTTDDFLDSDQGIDMLDGIAMMLIAIGENFKKIDSIHQRLLFPDIQLFAG